jgi:hypothetical protein
VIAVVLGGIAGGLLGVLCGFVLSLSLPGIAILRRQFWAGLLIASAALVAVISLQRNLA